MQEESKFQSVISMYEKYADEDGDSLAVKFDSEVISYKVLRRNVNYYTKVLMEAGVRKNDVVAIITKRSINMVIAMLAIMKSGAIYLPIEADLPKERIKFMLNDSKAKYCIVSDISEKMISFVQEYSQIFSISRNDEFKLDVKGVDIEPDDIAYMIYTSGTTGLPKGTLIMHKSLCNLVRWEKKYLNIDRNSKILQQFAFIFDGSVFEIFVSLASGAKLEIISDEVKADMREFLNRAENAILVTIPSLFKELLEYVKAMNEEGQLSKIRKVCLAGEATTPAIVRQFNSLVKENTCKLYNLYGPTEATVCTTAYEVKNIDYEVVPIGKPIDNTKVYIIKNNVLCRQGEEGELCISGIGLTKGYLNRDNLTKEKIIVNPCNSEELIYRSGDLARINEAGEVECLGRIDEQVKIRGFRIELSEIENRIVKIQGIKDAVVITKEINGTKQICAYYISDTVNDNNLIKDELRKKLPNYMIPMYLMKVDKFTVTKNGKLDKNNLPIPEIKESKEIIKLNGMKEELVGNTFNKILNCKKIGANSDFYELGGDSIKALRMVTELRKHGFEISVKEVMKGKTVGEIAKGLKSKRQAVYEENVFGKALLSPIQKRFFDTKLDKPEHFNQSFLLYSAEVLDLDILKKALSKVVSTHDLLRSVYKGDIEIIQKDSSDNEFFELLYREINEDSEEKILEVIKKIDYEYEQTMNLSNGPLVKGILFKNKNESYFLLCIHHLVVDGVSWRIIVDDLNEAYSQLADNKNEIVLDKTMSFKRWTSLLNEYVTDKKLESEKDYWNEVVSKVSKYRIPLRETGKKGLKRYNFELSIDETEDLLHSTSKAYNTEVNDLLITAILKSIQICTGNEGSSVFFERHGRENIFNDESIDKTVGWFTCLQPIAVNSLDISTESCICRVKEMLRRIPNKGIGYSMLKAFDSDCSNWYEPQITFNYLGEFDGKEENKLINIHTVEFGNEVGINNVFGSEIVFDGSILNGKLKFTVLYDTGKCTEVFIQKLSAIFYEELTKIIKQCKANECIHNTCSDYGEYEWSGEDLEKVQSKYNIEKIYPLTSMQQGMLYHKQLHENSSQYLIQTLYKVSGEIEKNKFKKSLEILQNKYEFLRAAIVYKNIEIPRAVIVKDRDIELNYIYLDNTDIDKQLKQLCKDDLNRNFDFEDDSLIRFSLIYVNNKPEYMLMSFNHIILDGWCESIILSEINDFYKSIGDNQVKVNNKTVFNYDLYLQKVKGDNVKEGIKYYEEQLKDNEFIKGIYNFGSYTSTEEVGTINKNISIDIERNIDKVSKKYNVTPNTILETVWGLTLQKYNYCQDVSYGRVVSGRNVDVSGIESAVGLFINTVPVRLNTESSESFSEVVKKMQEKAFVEQKYENCSLADIQDACGINGLLFDTIFAFGNYYSNDDENMFDKVYAREQTNFDLTVSITYSKAFNCEILYNTSKFSESDVLQILDRYILILGEAVRNPDVLIKDIRMVLPEEVALIKQINTDVDRDIEKYKNIVDIFKNVVSKNPEGIAVETVDRVITYRELDELSDIAANELINKGIKENEIIAIESAKKIEYVIGLLAIIKAGGAYLPINEDDPLSRRMFTLTDSEVKVILTNSIKVEYTDLVQLSVKDICENGDINKVNKLNRNGSRAYIMYTSGTTGQPKGVIIERRSIVNLILESNYVSFENIRILQTGALTFDASTFEIWGALLNGGYVYLAEKDIFLDADELKKVIDNKDINTLFLTTALFNNLVNEKIDVFSGLDQLLFGGEAASIEHVNRLLEYNSKLKFSNIYGPTETTTFALYYPINEKKGRIPIGKPIAGTQAYVLNGEKLCGLNIPGELCIGGYGVGKGYLNKEALTKEKFSEDYCPEYASEKTRIYRTGDLVKWNMDGDIEYLGRLDHQVKIRGMRIELDEIRNVFTDLVESKKIFIDVRELNGDKKIVAYYVAEEEINESNLITNLKKQLPDYMIPSFFIRIDRLIYNKNGKIDSKLLPEPSYLSIKSKDIILPESETEKKLSQLFADILCIKDISVDDDFFKLGGHSLKATKLVTKINKEFGIQIKIRDIMENRSVRKISKVIEVAPKDNADDLIISVSDEDI